MLREELGEAKKKKIVESGSAQLNGSAQYMDKYTQIKQECLEKGMAWNWELVEKIADKSEQRAQDLKVFEYIATFLAGVSVIFGFLISSLLWIFISCIVVVVGIVGIKTRNRTLEEVVWFKEQAKKDPDIQDAPEDASE